MELLTKYSTSRPVLMFYDYLLNEKSIAKGQEGDSSILHTINRRMAGWIGHIIRRNCLLIHFIEGNKIEMTGRRD